MLVGCLGVCSLTAFLHSANVAVWHGSVEAHSVVIQLLQEVQTRLRGPIHRCQRVAVAAACIASSGALLPLTRSNEKKYRSFTSPWSGSVKLFVSSLGLCLSKMDTTPLRDACSTEKRVRPKPGTISIDIWIRRCTPWASMMWPRSSPWPAPSS